MAGADQELARQLAALKDRAGHSYGQLAARLHVSTSTLHRYCTATAIPTEFATLERFARACGADREELLTLHRAWLLADAERRAEPADSTPELPDIKTPPARRRWPILLVVGVLVAGGAVGLWRYLDRSGSRVAPAPLSVSVITDNWDSVCGEWFYATQPPSKVAPPPGLPDVALWAAPLRAVPGSHLRLQVTVQGAAAQPPVVLHTAYVRIVTSKPAPRGYGYAMDSGCGGGLTPSSFALDLDSVDPHLRGVRGVGDSSKIPIEFPFQVSASDSQIFNLDAATRDRDVTWYLDLVWTSGDRQGTLRVDDHGKPFHTIGLAHDPMFFYDGTRWAPYPQ